MSAACDGCGAPLGGCKFVCGFCGRQTAQFAKTLDDEFEMLHEISRAAQSTSAKAHQGAENIGGSSGLEHINSSMNNFWANAPSPRHPDAIAQATRDALMGITGETDGNFHLSGGQAARLSRALGLIESLKSHPGQESVVSALVRQAEGKQALMDKGKMKGKYFYYAVGLIFFGLALAAALSIGAG